MEAQRMIDLAAIDVDRQRLLSRIASIVANQSCSADEKKAVVVDTINAIRQIGRLSGVTEGDV
jgi:hypothetical protein